jgi:hypothetical protein
MNIRNSIYKEFPVFIEGKENYYELRIDLEKDMCEYEYEVYGKSEFIRGSMHFKTDYAYPRYIHFPIKEMQNLFFQICIKQNKKNHKYYFHS